MFSLPLEIVSLNSKLRQSYYPYLMPTGPGETSESRQLNIYYPQASRPNPRPLVPWLLDFVLEGVPETSMVMWTRGTQPGSLCLRISRALSPSALPVRLRGLNRRAAVPVPGREGWASPIGVSNSRMYWFPTSPPCSVCEQGTITTLVDHSPASILGQLSVLHTVFPTGQCHLT